MPSGGYRAISGPMKGSKIPRKSKKNKDVDISSKIENKLPSDIIDDSKNAGMSPLDFMLMVMRDENADPIRRDRMAVSAAPYIHVKPTETKKNKKETTEEKAMKAASSGKFAPMMPPTLKAVK